MRFLERGKLNRCSMSPRTSGCRDLATGRAALLVSATLSTVLCLAVPSGPAVVARRACLLPLNGCTGMLVGSLEQTDVALFGLGVRQVRGAWGMPLTSAALDYSP